MPISTPPIASNLDVTRIGRNPQPAAVWPKPWANFFSSLFLSVFGWQRTYYGTLTHDFGSISAQSQATQTVTIQGARSGDVVVVRPTTAVNGIILDGTVTADNTVTVRAVNYSSGGIDPSSQVYTVLVFQQ